MAYVTPSTVSSGDVATAAAHNIIVNDVIALSPGHLILTTTERNALSGPLTGTEIYNTTTGAFEMYDGTSWVINRPFAMAAGTHTSAGGLNTVSFPSNRFSVAPIVVVQAVGAPGYSINTGWYMTVASASFQYVWADSPGGAGQSGRTLFYSAFQMTSTSATG
jgi:hypothetical protein